MYGGQLVQQVFDTGSFSGITQATMGEIIFLQKALRENAEMVMKSTVGYPQQGVNFTGSLAPIVPQSIQSTLDSATYTAEKLILFPQINKVSATSPLHETTRINEHGNSYLDPFIAEAGIGPVNETEYERLVIQIKYLAEHINLSDVSILCGILGPRGASMLSTRTQAGTLSLLGKLERLLVHADSALTPLSFDGIIKQVTAGAPGSVIDMEGATVSPQDLVDHVSATQNSPNYGSPSLIVCDHGSHGLLANIATSHGRHDQFKITGNQIQWGAKQMSVVTSYGAVPVMSMPLIRQEDTPNATTLGTPPVALGTLTPSIVSLGATAGSKFGVGAGAGSVGGAYRYKVTGVNDQGVTAPISLGPITINAGEAVRIEIQDTLAAGDSTLRYYRVYRSPVGGAAGTETYLGQFPVNNAGAPHTWIDDLNLNRPYTSPILILDMATLQWVKLLDFMRRPIAQTATAVPFLLMLFGALHMPTPKKNRVLLNCAVN